MFGSHFGNASLDHTQMAVAQIVWFPRCKTDTFIMEFNYASNGPDVYDLFATSRRSTCGKQAGTVTGTGTYADPYVIRVDLNGGVSAQSPDCGVAQTGPTEYTLSVTTAFSSEGTTADDTQYTIDCDFVIPTTAPSTGITSRVANYTCQAPDTIIFTYEQASSTAPYDVYSAGKQDTCSKSANQGSGAGQSGNSFVLEINVNDPLNACGVAALGSQTYSVLIYVQQLPDIITSSDVSYTLTCDFASSSSQVITSIALPVSNIPAQGTATQIQPSASLYVVSAPSGSVLSTFAVGDPIQLAAQLLDGPATGLRVRDCTARPGPALTPVVQILNGQGCTTENGLVRPFVGENPSGSQAYTGSFQGFKFSGFDTVYFECVADFCYVENDLTCLGTHCSGVGRRKREITNSTNKTLHATTISAYVIVRAEIPTNLTGAITTRNTSQHESSRHWNHDVIIVVASLGSMCLLALLLAIVLGIKVVTLTSMTPQDERSFAAKTEADTSTGVYNRCHGERGLHY